MTFRVGRRRGYFRAGTLSRSVGNRTASQAQRTQYEETKANCIRVRVAGWSKAFKMDFEDVLVSADDAYHSTHRIYVTKHQQPAS